jgi:hypothetical protein
VTEIRHVEQEQERLAEPARRLALWTAVLGAPVLWFVQFQANYTLVRVACATGHRWPLYAVSFGFLGAAVACGALGLRLRGDSGVGGDREAIERTRFMGLIGAAISGLFFLLIAAQAVPLFIFDPCEQ